MLVDPWSVGADPCHLNRGVLLALHAGRSHFVPCRGRPLRTVAAAVGLRDSQSQVGVDFESFAGRDGESHHPYAGRWAEAHLLASIDVVREHLHVALRGRGVAVLQHCSCRSDLVDDEGMTFYHVVQPMIHDRRTGLPSRSAGDHIRFLNHLLRGQHRDRPPRTDYRDVHPLDLAHPG